MELRKHINGTKMKWNGKTALVTGITGQDGSYLADFLLSKGYKVVGVRRRTSVIFTERIDHLLKNPNLVMEFYDLNDTGRTWQLLNKHRPDEIYNLAAQSHVRESFDVADHTVEGIAMGTLRILNAMKELLPNSRFYQASSSEMFGDNPDYPFNEESKFMPVSPYACAKVFAHNMIRNYREAYGLYACSGILFNHESPRRGETFVTRKITMAAARIKAGVQTSINLGNLDAYRDWGYAGEYVEAMWLMLQQEKADDFVIATGETHTVRDFLTHVFEYAGLGDYSNYVKIDKRLFRPHEVPYLIGNIDKAKARLGWKPKVTFQKLAEIMVDADYRKYTTGV